MSSRGHNNTHPGTEMSIGGVFHRQCDQASSTCRVLVRQDGTRRSLYKQYELIGSKIFDSHPSAEGSVEGSIVDRVGNYIRDSVLLGDEERMTGFASEHGSEWFRLIIRLRMRLRIRLMSDEKWGKRRETGARSSNGITQPLGVYGTALSIGI